MIKLNKLVLAHQQGFQCLKYLPLLIFNLKNIKSKFFIENPQQSLLL